MLILVLIDVQYSQKAIFSFEKGLIGQNHSSSGCHHWVTKSPPPIQQNFQSPPLLTAIWKTLNMVFKLKHCQFMMIRLTEKNDSTNIEHKTQPNNIF